MSWIRLVEKSGYEDYFGSVVTLYNVYRYEDGFTDELFTKAMKKATKQDNEHDFFQELMTETTKALPNYRRKQFLLN